MSNFLMKEAMDKIQIYSGSPTIGVREFGPNGV